MQPYIVSVDIRRAFDNINVSKLMQMVEPLFQCERYLLVKYQEVSLHHDMGSCLTDRAYCAAQLASSHWLSTQSAQPPKLDMSPLCGAVSSTAHRSYTFWPSTHMSGCSVPSNSTVLLEVILPACCHVLQRMLTQAASMVVW